jgi:cell division protein FtsI (penicillin-binding protein 3)
LRGGRLRNRAVTDMLEPGSSIKPFVMAAALESGRFDSASVIDTGTGSLVIDGVSVNDEHPLGRLDLAGVLSKSSNVAMAKIARELEPQQLWSTLTRFGFGQVTASQFPGESAGSLSNYANWRWVTMSSLSRGYSLAVTPLQLAQAYATLGSLGVTRPVSLLRVDADIAGTRAMSERNARTLISLLEATVKDGTGKRAASPGRRAQPQPWAAASGTSALAPPL